MSNTAYPSVMVQRIPGRNIRRRRHLLGQAVRLPLVGQIGTASLGVILAVWVTVLTAMVRQPLRNGVYLCGAREKPITLIRQLSPADRESEN